jgi:molecular chaperone IbpA
MTNKAISIFNQLRPLSVGFDDVFTHFESMFDHQNDTLNANVQNYPPYNIVRQVQIPMIYKLHLLDTVKKM